MTEETKNNWPSFDIKLWKNIFVISGKIANEEDAKNGLAVFCIRNADLEHKAFEIDLPKLAYLIDSETETKELIVVIQAESTKQGVVIGYRNPKGGNGACFLYELIFLNPQEIEKETH